MYTHKFPRKLVLLDVVDGGVQDSEETNRFGRCRDGEGMKCEVRCQKRLLNGLVKSTIISIINECGVVDCNE